jgi:two-component system, NtrC family, response regulator HydG
MKPTLAAISGPMIGEVVVITEEEWSIGREESNDLHLSNKSVSRHHCLIKKDGEAYKIEDLDSFNGTFVENVPIKEHVLKHGDMIEIGDSVFVFLLRQEESPKASSSVQIEIGTLLSQSTLRLRREESIYLQPERLRMVLPAGTRIAQDLNALLKLTTEMILIKSKQTLFRRLLELIFETLPAQHGAILIRQEGLKEFSPVISYDRNLGWEAPVSVNQAIVAQVVEDISGILCNDILESEVRSLLCAPIQFLQSIIGVVYLDTTDVTVRFDKDHLQLLTAMAAVGAMAFQNLLQTEWLEEENQRLRKEIFKEHRMIGESPVMQGIYTTIKKIAPTDCTVLICGETGTGKELVARALHDNSMRADRPFIVINCAALTETLLENELFGHEKGAFTGAVSQKKGKIELADSGTLFLDEIAELSILLQSKLLRVLQEREFDRVGGMNPIRVDIRLVAATNKDLKEAVKNRSFREDLFFRLNVVLLPVPPLRDRIEDIPLLARYFTVKYSRKFKRHVIEISPEAMAFLKRYAWPGNIRDLENAIERAVVMGSTELLLPEDLPDTVLEAGPPSGVALSTYHNSIRDAKRQVIQKAMEQSKGNYADAAKLLGIQRTYLHRVMRNLNLKSHPS